MFMLRVRNIRLRAGARLVAKLEEGTPFRIVRKHAGVSWWEVLVWCLRGRQRFHNNPFTPKDNHLVFLQALSDVRRRTGCDLGPILNRVVEPVDPWPFETIRAASRSMTRWLARWIS
jgi:hypothetical protein